MVRRDFLRKPFRHSEQNVAIWLIAANILVFALGMFFPELVYSLALNPAATLSGQVWQPLTYMFTHAGWSHLLFNMLGIFFFGTAVERSMGSREFALYYLLTGFLAGAFSLAVYVATGAMGAWLLGASGAVFALLLAYATIHPDAQIYIWGILPVRAPLLVIGYAVLELFSEFTSYNPSVAHLTHLAGFGFAWLYFLARFGVNPATRFFPRR